MVSEQSLWPISRSETTTRRRADTFSALVRVSQIKIPHETKSNIDRILQFVTLAEQVLNIRLVCNYYISSDRTQTLIFTDLVDRVHEMHDVEGAESVRQVLDVKCPRVVALDSTLKWRGDQMSLARDLHAYYASVEKRSVQRIRSSCCLTAKPTFTICLSSTAEQYRCIKTEHAHKLVP